MIFNYNNFINKSNLKPIVLSENYNTIKHLGKSDYKIGMVKNNHTITFKNIIKWLDDIKQEYDIIYSNSTNSKYIEFKDKQDNYYKLRFANHTPALTDLYEHKGINIDFDFNYNTFNVEIDNSYGYVTNDIKNIIINLQTKYFNIINDAKLDNILSDFEYMFSTKYSIILKKILDDLNIIDDEYNTASAIVESILTAYFDFRYYDGYDKFYKMKKEEQENKLKLKTSEYLASNGILIKTNNMKDMYLWNCEYPNINISGKENKKLRAKLKNDAFSELADKIKNNEIN